MEKQLQILAVIASDEVFHQIQPLMSRADLEVKRVRSGQHALALARDVAYDLIFTQHPLADLDIKELLSGVRSGDSRTSPVLILTRDTQLDRLAEFLDGVGVQACCIDVAPEQLERALIELVGLAVRVEDRVLVEMRVDLEGPRVQQCQAVNISESGLLIRCPQPPPVGLELRVRLHLPDRFEPVTAVAEVVRHTQPQEKVAGAGLRLLRTEAEARRRLAAFVARELSRQNQT